MTFLQEQTDPFSHQKNQGYLTGQMKEVVFFQHWNQQPTSWPSQQCLVGQIRIQGPILFPQIIYRITLRVERVPRAEITILHIALSGH